MHSFRKFQFIGGQTMRMTRTQGYRSASNSQMCFPPSRVKSLPFGGNVWRLWGMILFGPSVRELVIGPKSEKSILSKQCVMQYLTKTKFIQHLHITKFKFKLSWPLLPLVHQDSNSHFSQLAHKATFKGITIFEYGNVIDNCSTQC